MGETNLVVQKNLSIKNEKEIDSFIKDLHTKYDNLVVSKDTEKDTKKVIAELRKIKREMNAKRLEVQRAYEEPAKAFKQKIDEKLNSIESIISGLDSGVKELEEQRKLKKKTQIDETIQNMKQNYGFNGTISFDNRWLNKSYKMLDIEKDIKNKIQVAKRDADDWKIVKKYALNKGALPEYYEMFIGVYSTFDIQKMIDDDLAKKEAQQKELAKEQLKAQKARKVDSNGEIVNKIEKVSFTICGTSDEIDKLAKYIAKSNLDVIGKSERTEI